MTLNEYSAKKRREILDDLLEGRGPREGEFSSQDLAEAMKKGRPQMGPVVYEPWHMTLEFIFSGPGSDSVVIPVRLPSPERIVYLPVPEWVVENVWQGDVSGSFHFEGHALALLEAFHTLIGEEHNRGLFDSRIKQGRERAF